MVIKEILNKAYHSIPQQYQHVCDGYHDVKRFYKQAQWWDRNKINAWQLKRLQSIVKCAYSNTAGYRQLFDEAKISPNDLQSLSDIELFPFTSKELLRDNINDFTWQNGNGRIVRNSTSGSTGVPFVFYSDWKGAGSEYSFMDTMWESVGWKLNDVGLKIRGGICTSSDYAVCEHTGYHRYQVSSQLLNDENYSRIKEFIRRYKVTFLHVYPSTIAELSQMVISHGDNDKLPIRSIFVGSEKYYPWQYELTKSAFPKAKIMHWYGQSERVILAGWCENSTLFHCNPFYGLTEVIGNEGKLCSSGEIGELVGTSFWMQGTFFIRYKTGDRATVSGDDFCNTCNRNCIILTSIEGRKQDMIVGRSGKKMSLTVFDGWSMHGDLFSNVKLFRFVQTEAGKLILKILPKAPFEKNTFEQFKNKIRLFFSDDYTVEIELVDELPRSKSGKYSYLEQYLKID